MMTLTKVRSFIEYFLGALLVQARELTQSQTILQDQVEKMGNIYLKMLQMILVKLLMIYNIIQLS